MNAVLGPGSYRLLLALIVVVHHVSRLNLGEVAVYVFFNLSGYWMACVWRDRYRAEPGGYGTFIAARMFRLMPLFILANVTGMLVDTSLHRFGGSVDMANMGWLEGLHLGFSNVFILGYNHLPYMALVPAWSLDVEVQYYLLLPVLFWLAVRTRWLGLCGLIALSMVVRGTALQESLPGYALFFYVGMLACVYRWQPAPAVVRGSVILVSMMLTLLLFTPQGRGLIIGGSTRVPGFEEMNRVASAVLALLCIPVTIWTTSLASSRRDKMLGDLSYSVYIFHSPLAVAYGHWFGQLPPLQRAPYLIVYLVLTACVAVAAWRWVDKPLMAMRSRYLARAMGARPAASALKAA
jgi:peptidoglycan/LPS O-acetylase OafA/YrhL